MNKFLTGILLIAFPALLQAQGGADLLHAVMKKLDQVKDYTASGILKTNVAFIKAPVAEINVYYKRPDKMKIVNKSGISFIPKGSVNINLNQFLADINNFDVIDAGRDAETGWRVLKLLPRDEKGDIVLSVMYIDEKNLLVRKTRNTSRDSGTYELEMFYGKMTAYGLPDRVIFSFNTKEYKLPRGVTFDYDTGDKNDKDNMLKNKKGSVEITYSAFEINKGLDDKIFNQ